LAQISLCFKEATFDSDVGLRLDLNANCHILCGLNPIQIGAADPMSLLSFQSASDRSESIGKVTNRIKLRFVSGSRHRLDERVREAADDKQSLI
jgi:hypothetical protein